MALSKDEMDEMLGRLIPADLPLDPETSYRPSEPVRIADHLAATHVAPRPGAEAADAPPPSPVSPTGPRPGARRQDLAGTAVRQSGVVRSVSPIGARETVYGVQYRTDL